MSEQNPFSPPSAEVANPPSRGNHELRAPRSVGAGRGWGWIAEGFGLFRESWTVWVGVLLIWAVIVFGLTFIPVGSLATTLLFAVFEGGLMMGCYARSLGGRLQVGHLFAGFQQRFVALLGLGGFYLLGTLLIVAVFMGALMAAGGMEAIVAIDEAEASGAELDPEALGSGLMISMLVAMLMLIVLVMTFWFAPALVALHEVGVVRSMKLSFQGCLRNIVPFLLYGVILMILSLIAWMPVAMAGWSVLLGLLAPVGLLVLWSTVIASVYAAYRDIYLYE